MIEVAYPSYSSGEPRPMRAAVVRGIASEIRRKLFAGSIRPIEPKDLARRAGRLKVNGREVRLIWDLEHDVHDSHGATVLGICEYDPQVPHAVMISISSELADEPELFRSTAAHELGHAIFDMPAAMRGGARQSFGSGPARGQASGVIDWREWRADEFMGAFLAPPYHLSKAFARHATAADLPMRWKGASKLSAPVVCVREVGEDLIEGMVDALAEEFGVSPAFMAVRLRKCGHLVASF
jgi:hypothetical protein